MTGCQKVQQLLPQRQARTVARSQLLLHTRMVSIAARNQQSLINLSILPLTKFTMTRMKIATEPLSFARLLGLTLDAKLVRLLHDAHLNFRTLPSHALTKVLQGKIVAR